MSINVFLTKSEGADLTGLELRRCVAQRGSSVHRNDLAGDEAGLVGGQEPDGLGHVLGGSGLSEAGESTCLAQRVTFKSGVQ